MRRASILRRENSSASLNAIASLVKPLESEMHRELQWSIMLTQYCTTTNRDRKQFLCKLRPSSIEKIAQKSVTKTSFTIPRSGTRKHLKRAQLQNFTSGST